MVPHRRTHRSRGLRTTSEEILLEVMYEIPSLDGVRTCVVNADVINNRTRRLLMPVNEQIIPWAETAMPRPVRVVIDRA
jgi:ATP-dependent Clp protease ATP-binding subunit ClpX